jgi:hypothetical protein
MHPLALLAADRKGPRGRHAAERSDEFAPLNPDRHLSLPCEEVLSPGRY